MFRFQHNSPTLEANDTTDFYDAVADHYHLFYRNWSATLDREGASLRRLLTPLGVRTVLDASCGPGTQAIGLARFGFLVTAADINETMLAKAHENAIQYKVGDLIDFVQAGFLDLPQAVIGPFDAVLTKGSALAHLISDVEISATLRNFRQLLSPGGTLLIGIRNFDMLIEDRPRLIPGTFHDESDEQHILFDVWDWNDGPPVTATLNKFLVSGQGEDYQVKKHAVKYRALRRAELESMLYTAGFVDVKVEQQQWELLFTATRR